MNCPTCHSRISTFTLAIAFLWIGVGLALSLSGFTLWRLEALEDRLSRMPVEKHVSIDISGHYPIIHVDRQGRFDLVETMNNQDVFKKKEKGK